MRLGRFMTRGIRARRTTRLPVRRGDAYHKALSDVVSYVLARLRGRRPVQASLGRRGQGDERPRGRGPTRPSPPSNPEAGKIYGKGLSLAEAQEHRPRGRAARAGGVRAGGHPHGLGCKETVDKPTSEGVLAMYDPDEGIYREIGDGQIDLWCQEVVGAVNGNWKKNFVQKLHDMASRRENRVCECDNPSLVFMANGIWRLRGARPAQASPEVVALRKSATRSSDKEAARPSSTRCRTARRLTSGSCWTPTSPTTAGATCSVKVAGASLRSYHNWRVMVTFYNQAGHNGKSTFLDCLKSLVGYDGCMTSSLALLAGGADGGRFGVSNIVGVSLITCEDSDSGAYLKDNSRLKSIISHDAIGVERKNKGMFDYTPHALIVCAANDIPKTRDKGDAWLDRNIYVPFTGQFVGKADDKTIRSEWVVSPEFCEYLAYQALVKWDTVLRAARAGGGRAAEARVGSRQRHGGRVLGGRQRLD